MWLKKILFVIFICINISCGHTTQRPGRDDDSNPLLDMASAFLQDALANQNGNAGGGGGIAGVAALLGNLMQPGATGKSNSGLAQIISGLGSMLSNSNNGNGGGIDPSIIGNVIELFTQPDPQEDPGSHRQKRKAPSEESGIGLDSILQIASAFMNSQKQSGRSMGGNQGEGLMSLLPMVLQAVNSFSGPEGQKTQDRHKDHAWVLPPFLENIHVLWDHFSNSELAEALWHKSGINAIFKGFTGRDGKLDYDKLFDSLNNQSFRRRWIKAATVYLADWASYLANPEVYQRYFQTALMMTNGFLKSQGYPKTTFFDPARPSETISNLVDHIAKRHLSVKVDSRTYVKPAVSYIKELLKLGQARGLLQKFNATDLSDKLTDTLNLEVIEPVLKTHRAYRFAMENPQCDKFVLCDINSHDPNEKLGLAGFKSGTTKVGSMAAAWVISAHTGTPFWTLFAIINDPYNCETRFPVDCTGFHEGEAKVTTEYIHNEL